MRVSSVSNCQVIDLRNIAFLPSGTDEKPLKNDEKDEQNWVRVF